MIKNLLAAIAGMLAIARPLIERWLKKTDQTAQNKKKAFDNAKEQIESDAPVGDVQSSIDDLLNGL